MRVKTVPRHRIIQNIANVQSVSENVELKLEQSDNSFPKNEGKKESIKSSPDVLDMSNKSRTDQFQKFKYPKEFSACNEVKKKTSNYATEVLDMSDKNKCKVQPLDKSLNLRRLTDDFVNCRHHAFPSRKETNRSLLNDDNNNELPSNTKSHNRCSMAGPSNRSCKSSSEGNAINMPINEDDTTKAVNLSTKDRYKQDGEDTKNHSAGSDDKLKDTFLYKIMTDPTFLESIQKNKQSKKYICQFCKQQFPNSDSLADHMDVKKDESNQVVCCACKKTFAQKRYLRYHQRCHSERTKFTCYICTKKYTRLDNLTRHNAFHVNPDKFSCTFCGKTFARKDLLNKHLKCHDNKHRFFCEVCQKYFKGPLTLDNHKKIFHPVM